MRIGEAKNMEDLVSSLEAAKNRRLELRRPFEQVWWNNLALIAGDHYADWNPAQSRFEDRAPDPSKRAGYKARLVINHALSIARTDLAKLTKSRPVMEIIPNSDESKDIAATKVALAGLDFAEWKFKLSKQRKQALWWMLATGVGSVYVGYNHDDDGAGEFEFMIDPSTGDPVFLKSRQDELRQMGEQGLIEQPKIETYPLGELEYAVYTPFQLLPDETCLDFDELKNLITIDTVDVDILKSLYGRAARDVTPEENATMGAHEHRMLARSGIASGTGYSELTKSDPACRVYTFWLLPGVYGHNRFLRDGIYVRWCNGQKVIDSAKQFPFQDGRMPFAFFQHIPSATTIWPDSVMTHIRGPNLEIDKTVSQLIENKDYMANPMWRIATQHRIKGEIKNVAGGIVRYRHVPNIPPPEPVQGLQMPPQVENLLAGLRAQILDISGQSEVARGRVPTGVRSGVAVAYLQEEDDTKLGPTVENMEQAIAMMGSLTLERYSQYYTVDRIIRFYRPDGAFEVRKFKGADLKNNTDVVCQAGSAMPKMKAARQQYWLELASLGLVKDPDKLMQALELGEAEPDEREKARAQADRENQIMLHGVPESWARGPDPERDYEAGSGEEDELNRRAAAVPVKSWHNHEVHLQRHISVMMDQEFESMQVTKPEIARIFDEHVGMHQAELQKQQQAQMAMLQAAKGAPDGPPSEPGRAVPGQNGGAPPTPAGQGMPM